MCISYTTRVSPARPAAGASTAQPVETRCKPHAPQQDGTARRWTQACLPIANDGAGASSDPPESFGIAGYADCLASFIAALGLAKPHVLGLSFGGALALELRHRHPAIPQTLVLASAYAGWGGSLPADVAEARLQQALGLAEVSPEEFVAVLLPTMFAGATGAETIEAFRVSMLAFHPLGFRAMARASAENLRPALAQVDVPTLLVYGGNDTRAGPAVAHDLEAAIPGSTLVVLPDAGHLCNIERPDEFNNIVRTFLHRTTR